MSDCAGAGFDAFKVTFVNTFVGDHCVSWTPNYKRQTEINQHQSFRAPYVILDGRYPAPILQHSFDIYIEKATLREYHKNYFNLFATFITSDPMPLQMQTSGGTLYADFGSCYMIPPELKDPDNILWHRAGILRIQFLGTRLATVFD